MALTLTLLGRLALESDDAPVTGRATHRHRLALLALLGTARGRGWNRDKLLALLWPERDADRARGLLNQAVHALRQSLGAGTIITSGDELRLDPERVSSDVAAFEDAVDEGALERAAGLYAGPFLDGFFLSEAPEFERWVDRERARLAALHARVVESLAERAGAEGDWDRAVEWWQLRSAHDPFDSRIVQRLMRALDAAGHPAAAILLAESHQRLLRDELGIELSPDVQALAARLRSAPAARAPSGPVPTGAPRAPDEHVVPASPPPPRPRWVRYAGAALLLLPVMLLALRLAPDRVRPQPPGDSAAGALSPATADEIAKAVARELDRRQRGDTTRRAAAQRTVSVAAYELYLRGDDAALLRNDSTARLGLDYFRRAIALDSNYASAWAGLARMTLRTGGRGDRAAIARSHADAWNAASRAVALDDRLAEGHATLALAQMARHDLPGAEISLRRALDIEPRTARYREWLVKLLLWSGRSTEAVAEARRAVADEPLSPTANAELARALLGADKCREALEVLRAVDGIDPPMPRARSIKVQCLGRLGRWEEALVPLRAAGDTSDARLLGVYAHLLVGAGDHEAARATLARAQALATRDAAHSLAIAVAHEALGEIDAAIPAFERATDLGVLSALNDHAILTRSILDRHRADPRIVRLRARLGLQNR